MNGNLNIWDDNVCHVFHVAFQCYLLVLVFFKKNDISIYTCVCVFFPETWLVFQWLMVWISTLDFCSSAHVFFGSLPGGVGGWHWGNPLNFQYLSKRLSWWYDSSIYPPIFMTGWILYDIINVAGHRPIATLIIFDETKEESFWDEATRILDEVFSTLQTISHREIPKNSVIFSWRSAKLKMKAPKFNQITSNN